MRRAMVALALTLMTACGAGGRSGNGDGRLRVVASFYPLYEAAQRVGGDRVRVSNLTVAGAEPHDLELSTRQIDRIQSAAVVFYFGHGFQPAVAEAARQA